MLLICATKRRKQMAEKIPTSPHVTIYAFPLPSIASITTRVTGVTLFAGIATSPEGVQISIKCFCAHFFEGAAALGGVCLGAGPEGVIPAIEMIKQTYPPLIPLAKLSIAFPLVYHYTAGVRHVVRQWNQVEISTNATFLFFSSGITRSREYIPPKWSVPL